MKQFSALCAVVLGTITSFAFEVAAQKNTGSNQLLTGGLHNSGPALSAVTGTLTDPNFRAVIHALEQRSGTEKLAEPEVVSTSGRWVQRMRPDYILSQPQYASVTIYASAAANNDSQPAQLETRVFKVDKSIFAAMRNMPDLQTNNYSTMAESFFSKCGVDLTAPDRSVAYNDNKGLLFVKATPSELRTIERTIQALNQVAPQVHVKAYFIEVPEGDVETILKAGTVVDAKEQNPVEVIAADKMRLLLRQLESQNGVNTWGKPEVVSSSGRQTQMRATKDEGEVIVNDILIKKTSKNDHFVMDVMPYVLSDGYTINLQATVSKPEMLTALANIWDGQTLALISSKSDGKNRLVVFITATVVDAAGNRVYSDSKLPFKPSTIPPQPKLPTSSQ